MNRVELPLSRNALQRVLAAIVERNTGACNEIFDRSRHENVARLRERSESCSDVDGEASESFTVAFTLAGVESSADLNALVSCDLNDPSCAGDGTRRPIERREESVPSDVALVTAIEGEFTANGIPVGGK